MIEGKTASLIATSTELGALAANASAPARNCYRDFGRHLGLSFQIRDDVLGIWGDATVTGKSAATDITTRKKTLPTLYGLQHSETLRSLYRPETNGGGSVNEIVSELEKCGARSYAEEKEKHHADLAISYLDSAKPQGEAGELLHEMTRRLLGRTN
jgi:geranylgeranyl diphosphate synthase type I